MEEINKEEYTMDLGLVNVIGFFMIIPILIIFALPFVLIWNLKVLAISLGSVHIFLVLPIIFVGAIIHELIHGFTLALFARNGFKSIKFGVHWKLITPYCHCKESLKVKYYAIGMAMPLIIMGIIPAITALFTGNGFLLLFGILFTWAAGGDVIGLIMLSKLKMNDVVYDHPEKIGFYKEIRS